MKHLVIFVILFASSYNALAREDISVNNTVPELIKNYGYPVEVYQVMTADGYILNLYRIHFKNSEKTVLLQHGFLCSSADWIISGEFGLAFLLADQGYDVWLSNARNTVPPFNIVSDKTWDFEWHEIGIYDLPAIIDFILEITQQPDLYYIGHSEGTTTFYVMASMLPEYNKKIRAQISLAPIAYLTHVANPLLEFMEHAISSNDSDLFFDLFGREEFHPSEEILKICGDEVTSNQLLCHNSLFLLAGFNPESINSTMLPLLAQYSPAHYPIKSILHYLQEISSGKFCQYDYGAIENLQKYGTLRPPNYNLGAITAPVYLFYSYNDMWSNPVDVNKLCLELANCMGKFLISDFSTNHIDFLYGIKAKEQIYQKVLNLLARV